MSKTPFTQSSLNRAKPKERQYKIHGRDGLFVLVSPGGTKSFRFRYKYDNKFHEISIGKFGRGLMDIDSAYAKVYDYHTKLNQGINPKFIVAQPISTSKQFRDVAQLWLEHAIQGKAEQTVKKITRFVTMLNDYFALRDIEEIKTIELISMLKTIEARGHIETTKRLRSTIFNIYVYANSLELTERNPASELDKLIKLKKGGNYPFVSDKNEIKELMLAINDYKGAAEVRYALLLSAYTFVRPSELRFATWQEIDFENKLWTIPAERMKMKKEHLVPLAQPVIHALQSLQIINKHKTYIFNSYNRKSPISDGAIANALKIMGFKGRHCHHGFRHMASTTLNELGYNRDSIELQLAHATPGVRGVYNKAQKLADRTNMMDEWAEFLDNIIHTDK